MKADLQAVDSPKNENENEFVLFAFYSKQNKLVRFLGESMARQFCVRFFLTFSQNFLCKNSSFTTCLLILHRKHDLAVFNKTVRIQGVPR